MNTALILHITNFSAQICGASGWTTKSSVAAKFGTPVNNTSAIATATAVVTAGVDAAVTAEAAEVTTAAATDSGGGYGVRHSGRCGVTHYRWIAAAAGLIFVPVNEG